MKNKNHDEELQSRREFFKKAAKGTLPILGALLLINTPILSQASEIEPTGCEYGCGYSCNNTCAGRCTDSCSGCGGLCQTGCQSTCKGGCSRTCTGSCYFSCSGSSR